MRPEQIKLIKSGRRFRLRVRRLNSVKYFIQRLVKIMNSITISKYLRIRIENIFQHNYVPSRLELKCILGQTRKLNDSPENN